MSEDDAVWKREWLGEFISQRDRYNYPGITDDFGVDHGTDIARVFLQPISPVAMTRQYFPIFLMSVVELHVRSHFVFGEVDHGHYRVHLLTEVPKKTMDQIAENIDRYGPVSLHTEVTCRAHRPDDQACALAAPPGG